jgi:hypothetical protein
MLIEQALFASAPGDWCGGYRLVARSPGVEEDDARELAAWGPGNDCLLESGPDAVSINFFRLPSGAYGVSKTTPSLTKADDEGDHPTSTHSLIIPAVVLGRFANNPFALLNAAFGQGLLRSYHCWPFSPKLEPFHLAGKAAAVDTALLASIRTDPGLTWFEALVDAAVSASSVALATGPRRPRLIAALFNCLPVECRAEFSFSTGLKPSARRPFRVFCIADEPVEHRRLLREEVSVLDLSGKPPTNPTPRGGWSRFVGSAIATGRLEFLAHQLARIREGTDVADLNRIGDECLEALAGTSESQAPVDTGGDDPSPSAVDSSGSDPQREAALRRADGSHARHRSAVEAATTLHEAPEMAPDVDPWAPSQTLSARSPAAVQVLEELDDAVFEAIAGRAEAMEKLKHLWPEVLQRLGKDEVEESRLQYLRHAMSVWQHCIEGDEIRNPELAVSAIDVISLLMHSPLAPGDSPGG